MSEIVVCPNCGQKNRIQDNKRNKSKCGKCRTTLGDNTIESYTNKNKSHLFRTLLYGSIIIMGTIFLIKIDDTKSSTTIQTIEKEIKNNYPAMPMPHSGKIQKFVSSESVAPLTIKTSVGANYLVKIANYYSKSKVMTIFIQGGDTAKVKVPLGLYEIQYASGEEWYGYQYLFGYDTLCSKADTSFSFKDKGYQITGYTITLYRVTNGNLQTSHISLSEFLRE